MMNQEKTISDLAYHLWQARGCPMGSAELDWAEAERQVRGVRSQERALDAPLPVDAAPAPAPADPPPPAADPGAPRARKKAKR
jgi:hypothetical protein